MNKIGGIYFKKKSVDNKNLIEERNIFPSWKLIKNANNLLLFSKSITDNNIIICENLEYYFSGFPYPNFIAESSTNEENFEKEKFKIIANKLNFHKDKSLLEILGKYNIIIYNSKTESLEIFNDRWGFFNLYYFENDDFFIFCNDYEPILKFNNKIKNDLDTDALMEYLALGAPQNGKTFFKNIKTMPAGSKISLQNQKVDISMNFRKTKIKPSKKNIEELADDFFKSFKKELKTLLFWHPDMEITLTGGLDSRLILGAMSEKEKASRVFVTFASPHVNDGENQDIIIAQKIAKKFNLKHKIIKNPLFSIENLNSEYFSNLKNKDTVYISGFLGSESLQFFFPYSNDISEITRSLISSKGIDYNYNSHFFTNLDNEKSFYKKSKKAIKEIEKYINTEDCKKTKSKYLKQEILKSIKPVSSKYKEVPYTNFYLIRSFFSQHCGGAKSSMLMPSTLTKSLITPFDNFNLLKIIWSINPKYLNSFHWGLAFNIYKNNFSELATIESNSTLNKCNDKALPLIENGKNPVYEINLLYPDFEKIANAEIQNRYNTIFKFDNIYKDFYSANSDKRNIWSDLFIWLQYVNEIE